WPGYTWFARSGVCPEMKCHSCTRAARGRCVLPCATLLAINNGHVVEVSPGTLEDALADPVLGPELVIVHPNHSARDPSEDHRVFCERVSDGAALSRRSGGPRPPRPSGFHPDPAGVPGRQCGANRPGGGALA